MYIPFDRKLYNAKKPQELALENTFKLLVNVHTWICNRSGSFFGLGRKYLQSWLALERGSLHCCSPVSLYPFFLMSVLNCFKKPILSSSLPFHSKLCSDSVPSSPPWWHFVEAICSSARAVWFGQKGEESHSGAFCANLQLRCSFLVAMRLNPFTPTTNPKTATEISHLAQVEKFLCWRVPFCTKCYKHFLPEMDSALHSNSPADERENYPVEY